MRLSLPRRTGGRESLGHSGEGIGQIAYPIACSCSRFLCRERVEVGPVRTVYACGEYHTPARARRGCGELLSAALCISLLLRPGG
jgi:hypothetical protein